MKRLPLDNVLTLDELMALRQQFKSENRIVVFTNGVFDIIHPGHVAYLTEAKELGSVLIVGLNSDESVKMLDKGTNRPIQNEDARAVVLSALKPVDFVVCFDDETPENLITSITPDILVKGGDYAIEDIVGSDHVLKSGGEVKQLQFIDGYSTSAIERKIKNAD